VPKMKDNMRGSISDGLRALLGRHKGMMGGDPF
jgi:hypothetical protein